LLAPSNAQPAFAKPIERGNSNNPDLRADYSDPDIIRVGKDFHVISTNFVSMFGIQILHSKYLIKNANGQRIVCAANNNGKLDNSLEYITDTIEWGMTPCCD